MTNNGWLKPSKIRHGTPSGVTQHMRDGSTVCDACRLAKREYDIRRRGQSERILMSRRNARAQGKANMRLRAAHEDEYRIYYLEEKAILNAQEEADENDRQEEAK